jgi:hypothetical protein
MNGSGGAQPLSAWCRCPRKAEHDKAEHDERSFVTGQKMEFRIEGARALVHGRLEDTSLHFGSEAGVITGIGLDTTAEGTIDARGLLVLPGIVDVHGDAFERQVMPRPRVAFPLDIALL